MAKISAFVTIPAIFFVVFAFIQLVRFHLPASKIPVAEVTNIAFLFLWLITIVAMFSLLNIVVGTHYHLPIAPSVSLAGAFGLAILLRYQRGSLFTTINAPLTTPPNITQTIALTKKVHLNPRATIIVVVLAAALVGPHLLGLSTNYAAEGYTSELFPDENTALQVAYSGYREAVQWLATHSQKPARVGLVALPETLDEGSGVSWFNYNKDLLKRFVLREAHPTDKNFPYDYLVWPMHLVQTGYSIPTEWRSHIVYRVMGGNTIYCYILARSPTMLLNVKT